MIGVYFSGTGNTRYCIERFLEYYDKNLKAVSIEDKDIEEKVKEHEDIVLAYPTHYSNIPKIMKDFIISNKQLFDNKNVFIIVTMGLFSGDGSGCSARILKKFGANIIGGIHIKMPDCVGDVKILKKSLKKNKEIVLMADKKIKKIVKYVKKENVPRNGLGICNYIIGLLGQRLWFYNKSNTYSEDIKVDKDKCIKCEKCINICPMKNLNMVNGEIIAGDKCAICYRCINYCPKNAITLIGKEVVEQCYIEKYL